MKKIKLVFLPACMAVLLAACAGNSNTEAKKESTTQPDMVPTKVEPVNLPEPYATKSVKNNTKVMGWPVGKTPVAPDGFVVTKFADSLDHPRWIYVADNGDIFVAEANSAKSVLDKVTGKNKSADRITLFRDTNNDGLPDIRNTFINDLNKPFGMLAIGNKFYVANTDGVVEYPYIPGSTSVTVKGKQIVSLPADAKQRHWTKNIISNAAHSKLYITVGSASDHAENGIDKETRRANILEVNMDGSGEKIFASGLRNPVGMAWAPGTNTLWTAVNERDELGDDLVPDYLTSVQEGGFYGWPYSYYGQHEDPRLKDQQQPELVKKAIIPDVPLGNHTASLGLAFYTGNSFPQQYHNGAFIGQHGSWNSSLLRGYKVVFVPFKNGKPAGVPENFLTGFIANESKSEVFGRPVGVAVLKDGSLLVADDGGNVLWRVSKR